MMFKENNNSIKRENMFRWKKIIHIIESSKEMSVNVLGSLYTI